MNNNSRTNVILIVLAIIVAAGALYMFFAKGDEETVTAIEAPGTEAERSFLALTAEIGAISFDTGIFSDPRFRALQDIRTAVVPEASGRPDPFAPLQGIPSTPAQ